MIFVKVRFNTLPWKRNFVHIDSIISETSEQDRAVEAGREGDGGHWKLQGPAGDPVRK